MSRVTCANDAHRCAPLVARSYQPGHEYEGRSVGDIFAKRDMEYTSLLTRCGPRQDSGRAAAASLSATAWLRVAWVIETVRLAAPTSDVRAPSTVQWWYLHPTTGHRSPSLSPQSRGASAAVAPRKAAPRSATALLPTTPPAGSLLCRIRRTLDATRAHEKQTHQNIVITSLKMSDRSFVSKSRTIGMIKTLWFELLAPLFIHCWLFIIV